MIQTQRDNKLQRTCFINFLTKLESHTRPKTVGPRIRYSQPNYFLMPDDEPFTKPVIFHKNRRFEDESKKFKDPGQEKLCSTLDVDSKAWNRMPAYIQPPTKSIRRKPVKQDNPPHCYITAGHKVKPFTDTSLLAYHTQFKSRDRFQKNSQRKVCHYTSLEKKYYIY